MKTTIAAAGAGTGLPISSAAPGDAVAAQFAGVGIALILIATVVISGLRRPRPAAYRGIPLR